MTYSITRRSLLSAGTIFMALATQGALAQNVLPTKPVRIVVGYPAGQTVDIIARSYAAALSKELGQPIIVDNRAGANGTLGAQEVKKAAPDGSTLLLGTLGQMAINPALYKKLPYDSLKDFAPISQVLFGPLLLLANPAFPPNTVQELVIYARAHPGAVNFASGGNGITAHLAMEIFQAQAGIKLTHIPYKGSPAALNDLIGGQVHVMFDNMPSSIQHVRSGKLRAVAVTTAHRSPELPNLPTIAESGLPGFEATSWFGLLAPAGTPPAVISKLSLAIIKVLGQADVKKRISEQGGEVISETPEQFAAFIRSENTRFAKVIKDAGIKPE